MKLIGFKPITKTLRFKKKLLFIYKHNNSIYNKINFKKIKITKYSTCGRNNSGRLVSNRTFSLKKKKLIYNINFNNYLNYFLILNINKKKNKHRSAICVIKNILGNYSIIPYLFGFVPGFVQKNFNLNNSAVGMFGHLIFLKFIKNLIIISNIILSKDNFPKYVTSPGTRAVVHRKNLYDNNIIITLPSKKKKLIYNSDRAFIGTNGFYKLKKIYKAKAGFNKNNGKNIIVRGVAKNPVDHPNGGRTKVNKPEKSPWGWIAKCSK